MILIPLLSAESVIANPIANATPTAIPTTIPIPTTTIDPALAEALARSAQPLDFGMRLNPWFDWQVLLGIPFWVFITALFLLLLIVVNASWGFKIKTLAAVKGYVETLQRATQEDVQIWILGKTRKLTIECLKYYDSVISYYDKAKISRWHHNTPLSVIHIGGVPGMIVSDDFDQTRDIISEIALTYNLDEFNANQDSLLKLYQEKGIKNRVVEPVKNFGDYSTFGRGLLELLHPDGLPIPAYTIFMPEKFRKYFPKGRTAGHLGGEIIVDSRDLKIEGPKKKWWQELLPVGFICSVCLIAICAAWMVPL